MACSRPPEPITSTRKGITTCRKPSSAVLHSDRPLAGFASSFVAREHKDLHPERSRELLQSAKRARPAIVRCAE
jgi:hypothetical protein